MKNWAIKGLLTLALAFVAGVANTQAATMYLAPGTGEFSRSCNNVANIIVDTQGANTMAVDAFMIYNPNEIEILDQNSGLGGVQIREGSVYEAYPGNRVDGNRIRVTAFNRSGFFNGRGVLGSIAFRAKPGVERTSIAFEYSPGSSTDSNVAFEDTQDILDGVSGATYVFKDGPCGTDTVPPRVTTTSPAQGELDVASDSNVTFEITDNASGVDLSTLTVQVNDQLYEAEGARMFEAEGRATKYQITVDPLQDFYDLEPVKVKVNARDKNGNAMEEFVFNFNEFIPVEMCPQVPECPELRGVAGGIPRSGLITFIVLFGLSMLLNLYLMYGDHRFGRVHMKIRKIRK